MNTKYIAETIKTIWIIIRSLSTFILICFFCFFFYLFISYTTFLPSLNFLHIFLKGVEISCCIFFRLHLEHFFKMANIDAQFYIQNKIYKKNIVVFLTFVWHIEWAKIMDNSVLSESFVGFGRKMVQKTPEGIKRCRNFHPNLRPFRFAEKRILLIKSMVRMQHRNMCTILLHRDWLMTWSRVSLLFFARNLNFFQISFKVKIEL